MNSLRKFIPPPTVHFSTFCIQGVIVIRHLNTSMGADFAQSVSCMSLRHFWLLLKVVTCVLSQPYIAPTLRLTADQYQTHLDMVPMPRAAVYIPFLHLSYLPDPFSLTIMGNYSFLV